MSDKRRLYVSATTPVGTSNRKTAASIAVPISTSCSGERCEPPDEVHRHDHPGRHEEEELEGVVEPGGIRASHKPSSGSGATIVIVTSRYS